MDDLRRLTVRVLLGLLIFLVVGDFFDDLLWGNHVVAPVQFYALIGGLITGLFTPEIFRRPTGKKKEPEETEKKEAVGTVSD